MASGGGSGGSLPEGGSGLTSPLTTKGDLWGFTSVNARVPVGASGKVLTADPAAATGVSWQAVPSSSGGWTETAGVVHLTTITDSLCVGATATLTPPDASTENKFYFDESYAGHAAFIFRNPNVAINAYASVMAVNEDGTGCSITSFGKEWDGSVNPSFQKGDAGIFYQTIMAIDPPAGASLFIANGIGNIKFFTGVAGVYTETLRLTGGATPNALLNGSIFASQSFAGDFSVIRMANSDANGGAGVSVQNDRGTGHYGILAYTGTTFPAGGALADQVALESFGAANGLCLQTQDNTPIRIQTNQTLRYQIDGDGKMAWFGAATVVQQGPIADAAGGVVVDAEARAAINSALVAFRNYALLAT